MIRRLVLGFVTAAALLAPAGGAEAAGTTFVIDSTGDSEDASSLDGVCLVSDGGCTLRAAIQQANSSPGLDTIAFAIDSGPQTIDIGLPMGGSSLPTITDPVVIDGTTQPGFAGSPIIELNGYDNLPGLRISAGNSTVRGLVINRTAGDALLITSSGGNTIEGNYFGVDLAGTSVLSNSANIVIQSSNNVIGGTTAAARNVISGSNSAGVLVLDAGADPNGNVIRGNYVGTDATGTSALGNVNGIVLAASGNIVGGAMPGAANVISGNAGTGVYITGQGNHVLGNIIGADFSGTLPLGEQNGIEISGFSGTAANNVIGSSAPGGGNVISGNGQFGLLLYASDGGNVVQGNYVGTGTGGAGSVPNVNGIGIFASGESIGGTGPGEGNVVAFNTSLGIDVFQTATGNVLRGNSIHSNGDQGIQNFNNDALETAPPTIGDAGPVSGTACPNCVIDVYSDQADEGQIYHGSVAADASGDWTFPGAVSGPNLTATSTDPVSGTSQFSAPFMYCDDGDADFSCDTSDNCPVDSNPAQTDSDGDLAGDACDGPGSGNVDCNGPSNGVTAVDALKVLRWVAALSVAQSEPCLDIGQPRDLPPPDDWRMGDVDCDTDVDTVDALKILRALAGLPVALPAECPEVIPT